MKYFAHCETAGYEIHEITAKTERAAKIAATKIWAGNPTILLMDEDREDICVKKDGRWSDVE